MDWPPDGGWKRCTSCGACLRDDFRPGEAVLPHELGDSLPPAAREGSERSYLDAYTARIALTARRRWLRCDGPITGHATCRPAGSLTLVEPDAADPTVGLVLLARPGDPALRTLVAALAPSFDDVLVILDATDARPVPRARTIVRPLGGDFAAQRNAAQAALVTDWALHLDTDERPDAELLGALRPLCRLAGEDGIRAIGLRRRNMVDGCMSALYPDTQYRLLRAGERFENRVHERPVACRDWTRTTIWLDGGLVHHLTAERVEHRHETYGRMGQDAERDGDRAALLAPFPA